MHDDDDDDRRTGPPTRRRDELVDWRLHELEKCAEAHAARLDALERDVVPRSEQERRRDRGRAWAYQLAALVIAAGQVILVARGGR